ncbi:carbon-nitrogen hydrolase family protein [Dactylosporangium aurantiacum]|uniref:Carbon-nitrogen hydrolase family protein n=1 Tax=Dactylosporangium aurantiacum TaxID=35754 RepID=A0A9Q9I9G3_9ACTN|nr:carbon-nitrogen hydrolase family protein [Dactylosporangium aurantiacum]MDG6103639.1 carbon-nitrogen hydrolase family protein [Dactylosporangium aurantiacum]UWZ51872.1 carbon-nitrogen hydrolase family protein [Dactylosporangium aurantiacum]
MRVAAVQFAVGQDVSANLASCLRMIDQAAAEGAELVVLPEFCNHLSWYDDRDHARRMACRLGDAFLTAVADRAAHHGVHVKINVTLARDDGRTTGTNLLFGPSGELLGQSDKQTLMGSENDHLHRGSENGPVVPTAFGTVGMYACMEGVAPEVARGLALRGAQVLLNSLNSFATDEASLHIPVRAAENRVWVVAANKVGPLLPDDKLETISAGLKVPPQWLHGAGESQIVAPDGTVVAKGPRTGEAVVVADIDPAAALDKRRPDGTDRFAARRGPLYAAIGRPPQAPTRPPAAESLRAAMVRATTPDALRRHTRDVLAAGATLLVLPELAEPWVVPAMRELLDGTDAVAVTSVLEGGAHTGVVASGTGIVGRQPQLHPVARLAADVSRHGDGLATFDLPWGRLAVVVGDDAIYPEVFRLAAIAGVDVVAVPFTPAEDWELALGLPERAAENRLNIVAATPPGVPAAFYALSPDFTLWTAWEGPFTGRISHPVVTGVAADAPAATAVLAPAQSRNKLVSRGTDLLDGRPWQLVDALTR